MTDDSRSYPTQEYARQAGGKFAPGPGNPGRAVGSRNTVSRKAIAEIHRLSDAALQGLKDNIAAHDQRAIQYVLGHVDKWRTQRRIDVISTKPRKLSAVLS